MSEKQYPEKVRFKGTRFGIKNPEYEFQESDEWPFQWYVHGGTHHHMVSIEDVMNWGEYEPVEEEEPVYIIPFTKLTEILQDAGDLHPGASFTFFLEKHGVYPK